MVAGGRSAERRPPVRPLKITAPRRVCQQAANIERFQNYKRVERSCAAAIPPGWHVTYVLERSIANGEAYRTWPDWWPPRRKFYARLLWRSHSEWRATGWEWPKPKG